MEQNIPTKCPLVGQTAQDIFPSQYEHSLFGTLRIIVIDGGKVMFNLADACRALDINNSRQVKSRLHGRGVICADTPTQNQYGATVMQKMTYIDEANLYRCIFQSRKAEADKFQTWVFEEVLPQIRKTGGYIPIRNMRTGEALTDEEIMNEAERIVTRTLVSRNQHADGCITTTDIAKAIGMETHDLNSLLTDKGVQAWRRGQFRLTPQYDGRGLAQDRLFVYYAKNGKHKERTYLVWTQKGADFIANLVNNKQTF